MFGPLGVGTAIAAIGACPGGGRFGGWGLTRPEGFFDLAILTAGFGVLFNCNYYDRDEKLMSTARLSVFR